MKKKSFLKSLYVFIFCISSLISPNLFAAGETGHSDLMRLLSAIYGLNLDAADYMATVNQSVDKVPLSAATQSGRASAKLHFATVVTQSDLNEKDIEKIIKNNGKRSALQIMMIFLKKNALGGGVASLGNAESAEALLKGIKTGDGLLYAMGMHYLLDTSAPFHDGYKGALTNPIPLLNRLPFLNQFAFGHLVDGTSPDRLSIGKIVMAMDALGPFLITLRDSQKNQIGVNTEWLAYLKSQNVDVNSVESIRNWFLNQSIVKEILQKHIPANQSVDYTKVIVSELKERIQKLGFIADKNYLDNSLQMMIENVEQLKRHEGSKVSINDLLRQFVDQAWKDGQLNEKKVIAETVTDYLGFFEKTEKLSDLIYDRNYQDMPEYAQEAVKQQLDEKKSHTPHTREWLLDQIVEKLTRSMISQAWEKFNTAYLNDTVESEQVSIERSAMQKIENHFFKRTGKYSYNPGSEYWSKVFSTWFSMKNHERGNNIIEKIITFSDLIVRTKIYEGHQVHSISRALKVQMFFKTIIYIFSEELRSPLTSKGNFATYFKNIRERIIEQIKKDFPEGLLTEDMLTKSKKYNEFVNAKFNSDEAVGIIQKSALKVNQTAHKVQDLMNRRSQKTEAAGARLRCVNLF